MYDSTSDDVLLLKIIHVHKRLIKFKSTSSIMRNNINDENINIRSDDEIIILSDASSEYSSIISSSNDNRQMSNIFSSFRSFAFTLSITTYRERFEQEFEYVRYNESTMMKIKDRSSDSLNTNLKIFES